MGVNVTIPSIIVFAFDDVCIIILSVTSVHISNHPHKVAMFLQSRNGHLNVVKYLLNEAHCDPNVKTEAGCTPLHYACELVY